MPEKRVAETTQAPQNNADGNVVLAASEAARILQSKRLVRSGGRPAKPQHCVYCGQFLDQSGPGYVGRHFKTCEVRREMLTAGTRSRRAFPQARDRFIQALDTLAHMPLNPNVFVGLGYINAKDKIDTLIGPAQQWLAAFWAAWQKGDPTA